MSASHPLYVNGSNTGEDTGIQTLGGLGVLNLGQTLTTLTTAGATSSTLDDGNGNMTVKGVLTAANIANSGATISATTVASGTSIQNVLGSDATLLLQLAATAATGSYTIGIGPTLGAAAASPAIGVTIPLASQAYINQPIPNGWYADITLASCTVKGASLMNI